VNEIISLLLKSLRISRADFAFLDIPTDHGILLTPAKYAVFHMVLRGPAILVDNVTGQETPFNTGDYIFALHDSAHVLKSPGAFNIDHMTYFDSAHETDIPNALMVGKGPAGIKLLSGSFSLDQSAATPFLRVLPNFLRVAARGNANADESGSVFPTQEILGSSRRPGGSQYLARLIELFLVDAIRRCAPHIPLPRDAAELRYLRQIMATVQLMINEPEKKWSVSSLAKRANMSRSAFAVAFQSTVGVTPIQYLTELRMRRAADLLKYENRALKDVGYRVGYDSEIAFARAYKRFYGMTPRDYCKAESMVAKKYNLMLDHWSDFMDPYC